MNAKKIINELYEAEALAEMLMQKASDIKTKCRKAREKMAGVSTPAPKRDLNRLANRAVAKRLAFINKKVGS